MAEGSVDLLDVNLLIALVVEDHVHHEPAKRWLVGGVAPFATCPITQGGLVRFLVREGVAGEEARLLVRELVTADRHVFWADDLAFDRVDLGAVVGHRQVTDAYLAALARARGGRLVTFDRGLAAVHPDIVDLVATS